jgi:hypothetical protein
LCILRAVPPRQEGRTRRHERGVGCGGRFGDARRAALEADGEVVWSWRPDAGAKLSQGTIPAKVTGAKEPGPRGEHEVTVKTIAQGRPDDPAPPVVTTVCFLPMHTGRGCELAPGLPCALLLLEGHQCHPLGARVARGDENVSTIGHIKSCYLSSTPRHQRSIRGAGAYWIPLSRA